MRTPRLPPLGALRAFHAVARQRSFKLAAGALGVSATAVSHQIKLLESVPSAGSASAARRASA